MPRFVTLAPACLVVACGGHTGSPSATGGATSDAGGGAASGGSSGATGGSSGATGGSSGATGGSSGATGGSSGTAGSVTCGTQTCSAGDYCCHPKCVRDADPCSGVALYCDDAADCPSGFCCAAFADGGSFPVTAACQKSCDAAGEMIVCKLADPTSCPVGMICHITQRLPSQYGYCR